MRAACGLGIRLLPAGDLGSLKSSVGGWVGALRAKTLLSGIGFLINPGKERLSLF